MPAALEHFKSDPNRLGRGAGTYYRRGNSYKGKNYPGGYYSKYSEARDAKIKARGYSKHHVGIPSKAKTKHTRDGQIAW